MKGALCNMNCAISEIPINEIPSPLFSWNSVKEKMLLLLHILPWEKKKVTKRPGSGLDFFGSVSV